MNGQISNTILMDLCRLVADPKAIELDLRLQSFNPFSVLRVGHYEIRHTNTLRWLLDPKENHGLGDTFLRLFLSRALLDPDEGFKDLYHQVFAALLTSPDDIKVTGEFPLDDLRLDLLLGHTEFNIAIEAKVHAGQGHQQLADYRAMLTKKDPKKNAIYLYLTKDEGAPNDPQWTNILWSDCVLEPLDEIVSSDFLKSTMSEPQRYFIQAYVESLREIYSESGDEAEALAAGLCMQYESTIRELVKPRPDEKIKQILKKHRILLEHLTSRFKGEYADRAKAIRDALKGKNCETFDLRQPYIAFLPEKWTRADFPALYAADPNALPRVVFEVVNESRGDPFIKLMFCDLDMGFSENDSHWFLRKNLWDALAKVVASRDAPDKNWKKFDWDKVSPKTQTVYTIHGVWDRGRNTFTDEIWKAFSTNGIGVLQEAYEQMKLVDARD